MREISEDKKMNQRYLAVLAVVSIITCIVNNASAENCPYDSDYKYVLKKVLIDYLKDPAKSTMTMDEAGEMMNFYLANPIIVDSACPAQINALLDKADTQISDDGLTALGSRGIDKCSVCADGALCGEKNAKGQACTCKDIDRDGKSEYCLLRPIRAPESTCGVCPDGTVCGEKNAKDQTCTCKDANKDNKYEYCYLTPLTPPGTTTTTIPCLSEDTGDCRKKSCCPGLECKTDLFDNSGNDMQKTCCKPGECAQDNTCAKSGQTAGPGGRSICMNGQWVNSSCSSGDKKGYNCSDGAQVDWCNCSGNKWICINSPETQCKCRDQNSACNVSKTPCCQGLKPILLSQEQNGQCITAACGSICKPCGNGVCDPGENKCNCPQDCEDSASCPSKLFQTTFTELKKFHDACNSRVPVSDVCNAAINRYCQDHGFAGGFGVVEHSGDTAVVGCFGSGSSDIVQTSFTELNKQHSGCTSGVPDSAVCNAAINRYCRTKGYESGFGAVEHTGDSATIICVKSSGAKILQTSFTELKNSHGSCNSGIPNSDACNAAINRYCRTKGYESGFGAVEHNGDSASIVCTKPCGQIPVTTTSSTTITTTTTISPTTTITTTTTISTIATTTTSSTTTTTQPTGALVCEAVRSLSGTTSDASTAIQKCIDDASSGAVVELPAGRYYVDKPVLISKQITFRTQGKTSASSRCDYGDNHDCAEIIASEKLFDTRNILSVSGSGIVVDHIVVNGNKVARASSDAGAKCKSGNNVYGYNVLFQCSGNCEFKNSVSKNALCGTGLGLGGDGVLVYNNVIAFNGVHDVSGLWSDGMTVGDGSNLRVLNNEFIDNTDIDLIFGGCKNCRIQNNKITHTTAFSGGSFAALMIHAWPSTSGDYTGSDISNNAIDCGSNKRCGFGLYLGSDAWYITNVFGGSVHDNTVSNAQQGVLIDDAHNMEVYNNPVSNFAGSSKASCGTKPTNAYGMGTRSHDIDISKDTLGTTYKNVNWDGCIPNWWRQ
jgi:hypothetical protein